MGKRLVAGMGVAVSLVLAAGCASSAGASFPAPVPRSGVPSPTTTSSVVSVSAGLDGLPQLTLRPASGPVGTYVTISGQLTPDQVRTYESEIQRPAYFSLITDVLADCAKDPYDCSAGPPSLVGCELIVDLVHPLITLDTTTGRVTGSFTVGGEGTCFQDRPSGDSQATPPGRYDLAIGCHACSFARFRMTGSPRPESRST